MSLIEACCEEILSTELLREAESVLSREFSLHVLEINIQTVEWLC